MYFYGCLYIFFCVPTHHDCCHARAWIFCIEVRNLQRVHRKDTKAHTGYRASSSFALTCAANPLIPRSWCRRPCGASIITLSPRSIPDDLQGSHHWPQSRPQRPVLLPSKGNPFPRPQPRLHSGMLHILGVFFSLAGWCSLHSGERKKRFQRKRLRVGVFEKSQPSIERAQGAEHRLL